MDSKQHYIANRDLRAHHVPEIQVNALGPDFGVHRGAWDGVWSFALTYDGAAYFGGDSHVVGRLTQFADSVREAYGRDGKLPKLDLRLLRATLYFEARHWAKVTHGPMDERYAGYLAALLREIRGHV